MSDLAPGRKADMAMLLERRSKVVRYSDGYNKVQRKIDHLVEEGKHPVIHGLREQLIGAQAAGDHKAIQKLAKQIEEYANKQGWRKRWL